MTYNEKKFLNTLVEVGIALNREAMKKVLIDEGSTLHIIFAPETGYVSVAFKKDGIIKSAHRFDQFPEIVFQETDISEAHDV